jgi:DNA repair protein RecN (Recombination protein N)
MLASLSIRNFVLIDRLDIDFSRGLCVLTGETGAGKSILLDALGLAIGGRAESSFVRGGSDSGLKAMITATFDIPGDHEALARLANNDIEMPDPGEPVILRRILTGDGRSRAFVNDQAISAGTLRNIGETLIEIEGQFASHGLLDPSNHRTALDSFGRLEKMVAATRETWNTMTVAEKALETARDEIERIASEGDYLRHVYAEIDEFDPQEGEEKELSEARSLMMNSEKIAESINQSLDTLAGHKGLQTALSKAARSLERANEQAAGTLKAVLESMERTGNEAATTVDLLGDALRSLDQDPAQLERLDERLFGLRALARKHNTSVDSLAELRAEFARKLERLDDADRDLTRLQTEAREARAAYLDTSRRLHDARAKSAGALDKAINKELPHLRLEKAKFATQVTELAETAWSSHGIDNVTFDVTTNPGQPAGPINKVASGGELARLLLALKVALSTSNKVTTLVFDEVDAGVGGATAASVAERLSRLSNGVQVLVVTHSPQVAARGARHLHVMKSIETVDGGDNTVTAVTELSTGERREEIARMLAGAKVTEEARAAADRLIEEFAK